MKEDTTLLLVEDDSRLATMIKKYLDGNGFHVVWESRGDCVEERIAECSPRLIILDVMLPGMDGFSICRTIRHAFHGPIVMLTAKGEDMDQVVGLELGADDYVTKPVAPRVLLARITAILRRHPGSATTPPVPTPHTEEPERLVFGALQIDLRQRNVVLDGKRVDLTTNEFNLLALLASQEGEVVSRDDIYIKMRGIEYDGLDRSVDVFISRLRKKLGDNPKKPERIKTVWSAGYLFIRSSWGTAS